jgi:hypothetical protein
MKRHHLFTLIMATGLATLASGCRTTPEQTEARLERQLERLGRKLEAATDESGNSPAQLAERRRRLEAEIRKTLAALTRHLETMAAKELQPPAGAGKSAHGH